MKIWILFPIWVAVLAYIFLKVQDKDDTGVSAEEAKVVGVSTLDTAVGKDEEMEGVDANGYGPIYQVILEKRIAALRDHIEVIPKAEGADPVSFLWPVDEEGRPALPELMAIARSDSFYTWKPYADEWIRFYYPDDKLITLEVVDGESSFPMIGEAMWAVSERPFRRYILKTEGGTFCAISLEKVTSFDDTKRFSGEEVYHRFFYNQGSLGRASLMANGQVRRFQFVGSDVRASVHDWPHLAIHQNVYVKLGLSITLRRAPVDQMKMEAAVLKYYGFVGGLGLMKKGTPLAEMAQTLGDPTGVSDGLAVYHRKGEDYDRYYRLQLEGNCFDRFGEHWCEDNTNPPIEGSVDWMLEKTLLSAGSTGGGKGYDLGALTEENVAYIFDQFCERAPKASKSDWEKLCHAVSNLAEMKRTDGRILEVISSRFLEEDLPMSHAIQVLHATDRDRSRDDFAARIGKVIQMSRWAKDEVLARSGPLIADLQILIAYMGKEDSRTAGLIFQAMDHRVALVRSIAYSYWPWLPEEKCIKMLSKGLSDLDAKVRRRCAEAFCENCGTLAEHGRMLEQQLLKEKDGETRNYIALALKRLREAAELKVELNAAQ
jgi:hypothetical protein